MRGNGFHSKILYSILAVTLAMALVPIVVVSWRLISINGESLLASQQDLLAADVRGRAREVERHAALWRGRAVDLARSLELAGGAQAATGAWAGDVVARSNGSLLGVTVAWPGGEVREARGIAADALWPSVRDVTPTAEGALGAPRELGGRVVAPVAVTVGQQGALVAVVDLLAEVAPSSESLHQKTVSTFVVDAGGGLLAGAPGDALPSLVGPWRAGEESLVTTEIEPEDGPRLIGAVATASLPGDAKLGIGATVDRDAALATSRRMRSQALWASLFAAFVAFLAAILFAGRIATPMRELARGARAIAGGDLSHRIRIWSTDEIGQLADDFNHMAERLERQVEEMRRTAEDSRALFIGTVRGLAAAIDGKDPYTRGHSERVADYSAAMAAELGLSGEEIEKIRIGGLMHDIGKLAIEDKILRKPAPLTDAEFDIMREHPERGTKIMAEIPQMREFISGMRFHHEMVNGKGYPLGLSGDQIPMMARIVSVADTFDAMTTNRPYQKQMPIDVVFDKIRSMAGVRYDPKVVEALIAAYENGRIKLRMVRAPQ